ncbi:MAG TPA: IS4 family transposase [Hyphomicrobiaceae bacterium]|nr:IS4 family transposase [Hyphomicrobiaceae bacterium]
MVARSQVCVRRLAEGCWAAQMRFWRFLANERVTTERLIEGWSERTRVVAAGRHVLAIQDTSEIKFATTADNRRGLGKVKKGNAYGVLLHAMIGVDADSGVLLGLVGGRVWSREGDAAVPHAKRTLQDKESGRWIATAEAAEDTLSAAAQITVVHDREGEFYANWAHWTPAADRSDAGRVHQLTRLMHDHTVVKGGTVRKAVAALPPAGKGTIELRERADRAARTAHVTLRFGAVDLVRPKNTVEKGLPASIRVQAIELIEQHPPKDVEPVHWTLLTTHAIGTAADAWRIVGWYQRRWIIEQVFRVLKRQGLRIEDSQLESADRLCKLVAIAAKAATIAMQLVQARDGRDPQPASLVFTPDEIKVLGVLSQRMQGRTARQKNPHRPDSLAWATRIIAKLGGWHEYEAKPPGPITIQNGLAYFRTLAAGWAFQNV